ncbi:MAG: PD-(D/E)XK nuclease family protein, partial [Firmicutes bacterium]|nr:PD-(D/E)XK nuclease family protein [Candidatus Caballimonas caccae]
PFTFNEKEEDVELYNKIRLQLVDVFSYFNVRKMFDKLGVIDRQKRLTEALKSFNYNEEASINEQIYDAVLSILNEIDKLLGVDISPLEFRDIFVSGVSSLKLSILPQYKDAVFIGNFKEAGGLQNKYVFALELDSSVPNVSNDVSILTDNDINTLENIKILVEPKIRIVNHRSRENITMLLSAFSERLFICCPNTDKGGKQNIKSEIFSYLERLFKISTLEFSDRYLTKKQGMLSFSKDVSSFIKNSITDFSDACNFYYAIKGNKTLEAILNKANRKVAKVELIGHSLVGTYSSPTFLEDYASCPYKAFLERTLNVKDRDLGEVTSSKIGLLLHSVFKEYVLRMDEINDISTSNKIVEEIFSDVINAIDYA